MKKILSLAVLCLLAEAKKRGDGQEKVLATTTSVALQEDLTAPTDDAAEDDEESDDEASESGEETDEEETLIGSSTIRLQEEAPATTDGGATPAPATDGGATPAPATDGGATPAPATDGGATPAASGTEAEKGGLSTTKVLAAVVVVGALVGAGVFFLKKRQGGENEGGERDTFKAVKKVKPELRIQILPPQTLCEQNV